MSWTFDPRSSQTVGDWEVKLIASLKNGLYKDESEVWTLSVQTPEIYCASNTVLTAFLDNSEI